MKLLIQIYDADLFNKIAVLSYQDLRNKTINYVTFPLTSPQVVNVKIIKNSTLTIFNSYDGKLTPIWTATIDSPKAQIYQILYPETLKYNDDSTYFDELFMIANVLQKINGNVICSPDNTTNDLVYKKININYDTFIYNRYSQQFMVPTVSKNIRSTLPIKFVEESKASTITMPSAGRIRIINTNTFTMNGTRMILGDDKIKYGAIIRTTYTDGKQLLVSPFDATLVSIEKSVQGSFLNTFTFTKFVFMSTYFVPNDYSVCPGLSYLPGQTNDRILSYDNPGTDSELFMQQPMMCNKNTDNLFFNIYVIGQFNVGIKEGTMVDKDEKLGEIIEPCTVILLANRPIIWNKVSDKFSTYVIGGDFIGNFA